jgi:hypothetical protein
MKKKTALRFVSALGLFGLIGVLLEAGPFSISPAKAAQTNARDCASIVFGTTATSGSIAVTSSDYTATGLTVTMGTPTKVFSGGLGSTAKFGSSSAKGSLTFTFSSTVVTAVRLYAYQYGSDGAATLSVTTSAISAAKTASISATDVPTLTDLSGINIYLFTGLDNDAGAASTSITITTTTNIRFHLAKILFTLNGAPDTTTSSSSAAASSTPSSSTDSTASSSTDPAATTITFTSSTSTSKSYTTGNYGTITSGSFSYGYYRTYQDTGTFVRLVAPSYTGSLAGSFYNTEAIKQITGITLSYKMASSSDSGAKLYTGSSSLLTSYQSIAAKTSQSSLSFTFPSSDNIAFFRVDGGTSDFTIYSLSISYVGSGTQSLTYGGSGDSLNRINPLVYSGTLTSGVSSIAIPSTISQNGSTYTATTSKTYTYYTYAAVKADTALVDAAAYTEPADVAAYFIAFGTYPANYVTSSNFSSAYSIFGSKTRCVSTYNKTSGYVTAIPARLASSGTATYDDYYECDIDLTGSYAASSSPNRGVGRVIVFTGGFDSSRGATGYTYDPVAIFTDDHYATFQEYFNYGDSFSHRFDAELFRTSYQWGTSTVLSAA